MRGSVVKFKPGVITELKKESVPVSIPPSATPVALLNERMRPMRAMTNWVGPTAPIVSGGHPEQSLKLAAVKLRVGLTVWALRDAAVAATDANSPVEPSHEADGARYRGAGWRPCGWRLRIRSQAMIWAVVAWMPLAPRNASPGSCAPAMPAMTSDKMSKRFMKCGTVAGIAPVARMRLETLETSGGPGAAVTM